MSSRKRTISKTITNSKIPTRGEIILRNTVAKVRALPLLSIPLPAPPHPITWPVTTETLDRFSRRSPRSSPVCSGTPQMTLRPLLRPAVRRLSARGSLPKSAQLIWRTAASFTRSWQPHRRYLRVL